MLNARLFMMVSDLMAEGASSLRWKITVFVHTAEVWQQITVTQAPRVLRGGRRLLKPVCSLLPSSSCTDVALSSRVVVVVDLRVS